MSKSIKPTKIESTNIYNHHYLITIPLWDKTDLVL